MRRENRKETVKTQPPVHKFDPKKDANKQNQPEEKPILSEKHENKESSKLAELKTKKSGE